MFNMCSYTGCPSFEEKTATKKVMFTYSLIIEIEGATHTSKFDYHPLLIFPLKLRMPQFRWSQQVVIVLIKVNKKVHVHIHVSTLHQSDELTNREHFLTWIRFLNGYLIRKVEWHMTSTPDTDTTMHKIIGVVGSPLYLATPASTTDIYKNSYIQDAPYNLYKNVVRFPLVPVHTVRFFRAEKWPPNRAVKIVSKSRNFSAPKWFTLCDFFGTWFAFGDFI